MDTLETLKAQIIEALSECTNMGILDLIYKLLIKSR
jgi:hypothetical protein